MGTLLPCWHLSLVALTQVQGMGVAVHHCILRFREAIQR